MEILKNFDLKSLNTLQLQSFAEFYAELRSEADIHEILADSSLKKVPKRVLGGGSNLVMPTLVQGLVLKISNQGKTLLKEDSTHWYVQASAGENWHDFVQWTLAQGYWGLENLSLIPGTAGAAPIQNIGAYGVEVKDFIESVSAISLRDGSKKVFSNTECEFAYRDSYFKNNGRDQWIIWDVTFKLPKENRLALDYGDIRKEAERLGNEINPRTIAQAVINIRQSKLPDPKHIANVGSFFKNPIIPTSLRDQLLNNYPQLVSFQYGESQCKLAAGWLIDQAGWKGKSSGPVGMFEKQALVLVNRGNATADDVWDLAKQVSADVYAKFGVEIEPEPIRW